MQPCCHAVHTQVHVCIQVSCSPHAVQVSNLVAMQPTRMRGFASTLSCSLHASAGLQPPCHAAHTQVRVCTHVALQPTCRRGVQPNRLAAHMQCRFAPLLSCMRSHVTMPKHLQTNTQPRCHAARTQVQVCIHIVMQPTHTRGFAQPSRVQPTRVRGFAFVHPRCRAAHTHARVCTAMSCAIRTHARVCTHVVHLSCSPQASSLRLRC